MDGFGSGLVESAPRGSSAASWACLVRRLPAGPRRGGRAFGLRGVRRGRWRRATWCQFLGYVRLPAAAGSAVRRSPLSSIPAWNSRPWRWRGVPPWWCRAVPFLWAACVFGWWLLTLGWIDAETLRLPDVLTLPLIVAGLAETIWLEPEALNSRVAGGGAGIWLVMAACHRLPAAAQARGIGHGRCEAVVRGRRLGGHCGAALGCGAWLRASPVMGRCFAVAGTRLTATLRLPFGPFLACAAWALFLFAD